MKQYLQYNWWKYLAILLIPILLWTTVFGILQKPAAHQRLHILYIGEKLDTAALEQQLSAALPTLTTQQLKEIRVNTERPELTSLGTLLSARIFSYDIIILEQSYMQDSIGQTCFSPLPDALTDHFPNIYWENETAYALLAGESSRFSDFYTGEQDCYVFISPESVNFGGLSGNGSSGNDAALQAVYYLLETAL